MPKLSFFSIPLVDMSTSTTTASSMISSASTATPSRITLYRFEEDRAQWDLSPFVNKLDALLRFSNANYEIAHGSAFKAPRSKAPYIEIDHNGDLIPDSSYLYNKLVKDGLCDDLDHGLTDQEKASSLALTALVEDRLYWLLVKDRWSDHFYVTRDEGPLSSIPWPPRVLVGFLLSRKIAGAMQAVGHDQRTNEECDQMMTEGLFALDTALGEKQYVFGRDRPTSIDAVFFGMLVALIHGSKFNPNLFQHLQSHPKLIAYAENLKSAWFKERPDVKAR